MKNNPSFMGLPIPQITKKNLDQTVQNLSKNSKISLYFLYSEFLIRAKRNPNYALALIDGNILAVDGKGLNWSFWRKSKPSLLIRLYSFLNKTIRPKIVLKIVFLPFVLVLDALSLIWHLVVLKDTNFLNQNELILGRDYIYDLMKIAHAKGWTVSFIAGVSGELNTQKILAKIKLLYPKLKVKIWFSDPSSKLMKDELILTKKLELSTDNLYQNFPELLEAKEFLKAEKSDLVIVAIGGLSGKQEFFIDDLQKDAQINFRLATGIGAALDHLGAGKKQKQPPQIFQKLGLEWLYRFWILPYRRLRILDSVVGLWLWTAWDQLETTKFDKEIQE